MYSLICVIIMFVCISIIKHIHGKSVSYPYFRVWPVLMVAIFAAIAGLLNSLGHIVPDTDQYVRFAGMIAALGWIGSVGASFGMDAAPFVRGASSGQKFLGGVLSGILYPIILVATLPGGVLSATLEGLRQIHQW